MVSLKDIARELDISVSLVSKVLSGRLGTSGVRAEVKEKITQRAREMGYVRNQTAVALQSGQRGAIGVLIHPWGERGTEISDRFVRGVSDALGANTYRLWLTFFEQDSDFFRRMKIEDLPRQIDALIVAGVPHPSLLPHLVNLDKSGLPVVMAEEDAKPSRLINIAIDTNCQGRLPTEHLIARGCRKVAHIAVMKSRQQGYVDALRAAGIRVERRHIISVPDYKMESGRLAVRELLRLKTPFDGIVAQSDYQAWGAIIELQARGIRIPDEVRVVGVDDSPICTLSPLAISSVTDEARQVGMEAAEAALKRLRREPATSKRLQPHMVVRASS